MRSEWSKAVIEFVVVRRERRKMVVVEDVEGSPSMTFKSTHTSNDLLLPTLHHTQNINQLLIALPTRDQVFKHEHEV